MGIKVTIFYFGFTSQCHKCKTNTSELKIPLHATRYHGYLFWIQTLHLQKFKASLKIPHPTDGH